MSYRHWTLDDIPWDRFDRTRVVDDEMRMVKAAAMVEYNAADYVAYLDHVFYDDPRFMDAAHQWGEEERQHGRALSRWAQLVDPDYDFETRFARFRDGFKIEINVDRSIRGSRCGEMVARCMVEVGTSSYYSAIADGTHEPVLQAVCRKIAADELRHYKLFYDHLKRYLDIERLNKVQRLRVALGRIAETDSDELAYAYYAANSAGEPYDRDVYNRAYMSRAYSYYKQPHIERGMAMIFKAVGLRPRSTLCSAAAAGTRWYLQTRQKRLAREAA